ncbi:Transcriptional regulator STP3 [Hanseniaspora osmophila]|uniref:Transcriptional regulator STP3 n=1 Tax=Hanseniaspora osmophila TaxID=56408 RepID=A0A1E5REZ9_9ASCO|nr:Transcriptional regulator STP3 [Hanseniaspora osmophila]
MGYIHFDRVAVPNDNLGISLGQLHEQLQDIEKYEQKLLQNKENYEYNGKRNGDDDDDKYGMEDLIKTDNNDEINNENNIGEKNINNHQKNYFETDEKNFDDFLKDIMGYTSSANSDENIVSLQNNMINSSLQINETLDESFNKNDFYEESLDEEMNWNHYLSGASNTTTTTTDSDVNKTSSHNFINEIFDASVLSSPEMSFTMSPICADFLLGNRNTRDSVSSINSIGLFVLDEIHNDDNNDITNISVFDEIHSNIETSKIKKSRGRPRGSSNSTRKVTKPEQIEKIQQKNAKYAKKYVPKHVKEMHCVVINGITIKKTTDGKLPCPYCNTAIFKEKAYLIRHMKKHNPIKDFKCPFWNNQTKSHLCHHSGEFTRKDAFKAHLSSLHFLHEKKDATCTNDENDITKHTHNANTRGRCAECFQEFGSIKEWLIKHIETGQCKKMLIKDCAQGQKLRRRLEKKEHSLLY